jgi:hypothetical protein
MITLKKKKNPLMKTLNKTTTLNKNRLYKKKIDSNLENLYDQKLLY